MNLGLIEEAPTTIWLKESICPVCGKIYFPKGLWAWKIIVKKKKLPVCTYGCMRSHEKGEKDVTEGV